MIDEIYNSRVISTSDSRSSEEWLILSDEFEAQLTEKQIEIFHRLCDLQSETSADEIRDACKTGFNFKDRVVLMREIQEWYCKECSLIRLHSFCNMKTPGLAGGSKELKAIRLEIKTPFDYNKFAATNCKKIKRRSSQSE